MTDYTRLKEAIAEVIRNNDRQEITGDLLQEQLFNIIDSINETKQDEITDLDAIRAGAAAGATAYQKPADGIPVEDLADSVASAIALAMTAYQKPQDGIPATDLDSSVQESLGKADTAYQLPSDGIPKTDLDAGVQDSLDKADTALQQHQSLADCVQVNAQTFTDAQKAQARDNIGAGDAQASDIFVEGVISQTQAWSGSASTGYTYTLSNIVRGKIPRAFIDQAVSVGATFNSGTGYFEMNGLTDLTYTDMLNSIAAGPIPVNISYALAGNKTARTNIKRPQTYMQQLDWTGHDCNVEAFYIDNSGNLLYINPTTPSRVFDNSKRMKRVIGTLNASGVNGWSNCFLAMWALEEITIYGLKANISFTESPKLSMASIAYMINNAGTATFTITLEAGAYAAAMADTTVQTALAAHTNVTLASA